MSSVQARTPVAPVIRTRGTRVRRVSVGCRLQHLPSEEIPSFTDVFLVSPRLDLQLRTVPPSSSPSPHSACSRRGVSWHTPAQPPPFASHTHMLHRRTRPMLRRCPRSRSFPDSNYSHCCFPSLPIPLSRLCSVHSVYSAEDVWPRWR